MPLEPGKSRESFSHNVSAEVAAGKPQKQAVAIAYSEQRRHPHAADGAVVDDSAPNVSPMPDNVGDVVGVSDAGLPLVSMPNGPVEVHPRGLDQDQAAQYAHHLVSGLPSVSDMGGVPTPQQQADLSDVEGQALNRTAGDTFSLLKSEQDGEPAQLADAGGGRLGMVRDFVLRAYPPENPDTVPISTGEPTVAPESQVPITTGEPTVRPESENPGPNFATEEASKMEDAIEHPDRYGLTPHDVPLLRQNYETFMRQHWDELQGLHMTPDEIRGIPPMSDRLALAQPETEPEVNVPKGYEPPSQEPPPAEEGGFGASGPYAMIGMAKRMLPISTGQGPTAPTGASAAWVGADGKPVDQRAVPRPPAEAPTPKNVMDHALAVAKVLGVPAEIVKGVAGAENAGRVSNDVSKAGAMGWGQLMPATAKDLGVDRRDPFQNAEGSVKYLGQLFAKFHDWGKAVAAYNAGPGNIDKGIIPAETKAYVPSVAKAGGPAAAKLLGDMATGATGTPAPEPPKSPEGEAAASRMLSALPGAPRYQAPASAPPGPTQPLGPMNADDAARLILGNPKAVQDFASERGWTVDQAQKVLSNPSSSTDRTNIQDFASRTMSGSPGHGVSYAAPASGSAAPAMSREDLEPFTQQQAMPPIETGPGAGAPPPPSSPLGGTAPTPDFSQQIIGGAQAAAKPFEDIATESEAASNQLGTALGEEGRQKAQAAAALQSTLQPTVEQHESFVKDAMARGQTIFARAQQAWDHYATMHVDPDHWWSSRSAGQKAMGVLGVLLSGFSGGRNNAAMDVMQKQIDRDVDAQKANVGIAKGAAQGQESLYNMNLRLLGDETAATTATQAMLWKSYAAKLDQIAGTAGTTADKAKATIAGLAAKAKYAQMMQEAQGRTLDFLTKGNEAAFTIEQRQNMMRMLSGGAGGPGGTAAAEAYRASAYHKMGIGYVPGFGPVNQAVEKDAIEANSNFQNAQKALAGYVALLRDPNSSLQARDAAAGFAKAALGHYFESRGAAMIPDEEKNAVNAVVNPGWWRNYFGKGMAADRAQQALEMLSTAHRGVMQSYTGAPAPSVDFAKGT